MRSDCVNDCYQDKIRHVCKIDRGILMSNSLIRKAYLVNGNDRLISCYDPEYNQMSFSIKKDCEKMCKVECNVRYYPIEIMTTDIHNNHAWNIFHSEFPDIFVRHVPEMTLMGFVCNFGGLLGMWLGLSLLTMINNVYHVVTNVVYPKNFNLINKIVYRGKRNVARSNKSVNHW